MRLESLKDFMVRAFSAMPSKARRYFNEEELQFLYTELDWAHRGKKFDSASAFDSPFIWRVARATREEWTDFDDDLERDHTILRIGKRISELETKLGIAPNNSLPAAYKRPQLRVIK